MRFWPIPVLFPMLISIRSKSTPRHANLPSPLASLISPPPTPTDTHEPAHAPPTPDPPLISAPIPLLPAQLHNNLGNSLREAGRPQEAVLAYTASIQVRGVIIYIYIYIYIYILLEVADYQCLLEAARGRARLHRLHPGARTHPYVEKTSLLNLYRSCNNYSDFKFSDGPS
jgi:hypothetical protein